MITLRILCLLFLMPLIPEFIGEGSATSFTLAQCTKLPQPTEMHGCAVVGKRLYTFGGHTSNGYVKAVLSAEISDKGDIGPWRAETPIPDLRAYIGNSVEVINNRIYVITGTVARRAIATDNELDAMNNVVWTTVGAEGHLAPWSTSEPFPGKTRANVATCSTDDHLYVLGGYSSQGINNEILCADISPEGAPVNWRQCASLPDPMWFHGAAILDKRMYAWGGLNTPNKSNTNSRVVSAEIRSDGSVGTWRDETPMPTPVYSAAFCGFNDYLICLGGRLKNGYPTDNIYFARLQNGLVGQWQNIPTNLQSRVYHSLGLDRSRGRIYVTGGRYRPPGVITGGTPIDAVQAFQLEQSSVSSAPSNVLPFADSAGIKKSLASGRSVLLYFYSPEVPAVRRFEEGVLNAPGFTSLTSGLDVQKVDSSRSTDLCYEYGVFRVPSLTLLRPDGSIKRSGVLLTLEEVKTFLSGK